MEPRDAGYCDADIEATSFDQSCTNDTDCVLVDVGQISLLDMRFPFDEERCVLRTARDPHEPSDVVRESIEVVRAAWRPGRGHSTLLRDGRSKRGPLPGSSAADLLGFHARARTVGLAFPGRKSCVRFHYIVRGSAWLRVDNADEPDVALSGGDLATLRADVELPDHTAGVAPRDVIDTHGGAAWMVAEHVRVAERQDMQKAATLLRDGARLAEASRLTGYASEASFSHAFRQWAGVAPGAWRRKPMPG
jgi:hypothetical protein